VPRDFKVGDLVVPGDKYYRALGIDAKSKMEGPLFWDVALDQSVTVLWDTVGVVVEVTPGGRHARSIEAPDLLTVQVLFNGRVMRCDQGRLALTKAAFK